MKNHMNTLEKEIKNLKSILGSIQTRDLAKNLLKEFKFYLTSEDIKNIKNDKSKKWEYIVKRVEENYRKYQKNPKFDAFIEIFKKSKEIIKNGNSFAHNLSIELYEKEISEISKKNNILANTEKICFLLYLQVPENLFMNCYNLLDVYFNNNMKRSFVRNNPIDNFFK